MNTVRKRVYDTAKKEGRVCELCGWLITKKNWEKGYRLCAGCYSAYQGVRPKKGAYPAADEPKDRTGEM